MRFEEVMEGSFSLSLSDPHELRIMWDEYR